MTKRALDLFLFAAPLVLVACSNSGNHKADAWVDDDAPVDRPIFLDSFPAIDANNVVDTSILPDTKAPAVDVGPAADVGPGVDGQGNRADAWVDDDAPVDRPIFLDSLPAMDANNVVDADGTKIDGSSDACPNLAGEYKLTTEIVSTTCKVGLNVITQPDTYTFTQTAPSCQFTMTNSIYTGPIYTGHFSMAGSQAKVIWDSVTPAPTAAAYAVTYTSEDLTITPGTTVGSSTIVGTFTWHSAAGCDGTTNVCSGSVPAGCPTPQ